MAVTVCAARAGEGTHALALALTYAHAGADAETRETARRGVERETLALLVTSPPSE